MELETKSLVTQYFRYLAKKDLDKLLPLFDDEAEIYEPISKQGLVSGKTSIEMFLKFITGIDARLSFKIHSVSPPTEALTGPKAKATLWVESYGIIQYHHTFLLNPFERIQPNGNNAIRRLEIEFGHNDNN